MERIRWYVLELDWIQKLITCIIMFRNHFLKVLLNFQDDMLQTNEHSKNTDSNHFSLNIWWRTIKWAYYETGIRRSICMNLYGSFQIKAPLGRQQSTLVLATFGPAVSLLVLLA